MNQRRLQAIMLVSTLTLLALIVLALALNRPAPAPPTIINITRQEYDETYNRWRQKDVVEYHIGIREVTSTTNCYLGSFVGKETRMNGQEGCRDYNRYRTAEALFAAVNARLDAVQNPSEEDQLTLWSVEFDPEMGYPRSLAIEAVPGASGTAVTSTTTVENINILKVGGPGTPTLPATP